MAKIPEQLFKAKRRTVADLKPGERASFPLALLAVDQDRNAFISMTAELAPPFDNKLEYGEVWVDDTGRYHVDLKSTTGHRFEPKDVTLFVQHGLLKPIESITWSPEPERPCSEGPSAGTPSYSA